MRVRARGRLLYFLAAAALALPSSCKNPALGGVVELVPGIVTKPMQARVPYWSFPGSAGSYRYFVYPTGSTPPASPSWTAFDASNSAECPVYADLVDLLYDSDAWPRGPARVSSPRSIYLFAPAALALAEGQGYSILLQQSRDGGWQDIPAGAVLVDATAPAAPAAAATYAAREVRSSKPSWSWTGPADAAYFLCSLESKDPSSGYSLVSQSLANASPAPSGSGTIAAFKPPIDLPIASTWVYRLSLRSIDAAGNRSAPLVLDKYALPAENSLAPSIGVDAAAFGTDPGTGLPATGSPTPTWTWSLDPRCSAEATSYRCQLLAGTAMPEPYAWVEKSGASFTAGTDSPAMDGTAAMPAAPLGLGRWTLYVEAYYPALKAAGASGGDAYAAGWSSAASFPVIVSGDLPPRPAFAAAAGRSLGGAVSPWWSWADLSADPKVASLGYELCYVYLDTAPDPDEYKTATVKGSLPKAATSFTPDVGTLSPAMASGSVSLAIRAVDAAGVSSAVASQTCVADFDPPSLAIERASAGVSPFYYLSEAFVLRFSEPMNQASVQAAVSIAPTAGGAAASIAVAEVAGSDACSFTVTPNADLAPNTQYTLAAAASAADAAGNLLAAAASKSFATGVPVYPRTYSAAATAAFAALVPDANLRAAIAAGGGSLAIADKRDTAYLHEVRSVDYTSSTNAATDVINLTGLQNCVALSKLTLVPYVVVDALANSATTIVKTSTVALAGSASLASCAALRQLTLQGYNDDAATTPFSFITSLSNLVGLDLSFCKASSVTSQLVGLSKLKSLVLADCGISSIEDIKGLALLTSIDISDNAVSSVPADSKWLSSADDKVFKAPRNGLGLSSLATINSIVGLRALYLCGNPLTAMPSFATLTSLQSVRLQACGLSGSVDISSACLDADQANSTIVRLLDLSGNAITSVTGTAARALTKYSLNRLDCSGNTGLTSLSLAGFTGLNALNLSGCTSLTDVTFLYAITSLKNINLSGCTGLTTAKVAALKTALPGATVTWP